MAALVDSSTRASVPINWSTTVPGISRTIRKTRIVTPMSVGTSERTRLSMYVRMVTRWYTSAGSRKAGKPHAARASVR